MKLKMRLKMKLKMKLKIKMKMNMNMNMNMKIEIKIKLKIKKIKKNHFCLVGFNFFLTCFFHDIIFLKFLSQKSHILVVTFQLYKLLHFIMHSKCSCYYNFIFLIFMTLERLFRRKLREEGKSEISYPYNNSGRTSLDRVTVPLTEVSLPILSVRIARILSTRGRL